jgi:hypothetical protein
MAKQHWISYGSTPDHLQSLVRRAATKTKDTWTVHPDARPDDTVLFYLTKPVGAFVASGIVIKRSRELWEGPDGAKHATAWVREINLLPSPVTREEAKTKFPGLKWLRVPMGFARRSYAARDIERITTLGGRRATR